MTARRGVTEQYAQHRDAAPPHADRRDADPPRRRRRDDLRHVRHARHPPALHRPGAGPASRREGLRGDEHPDAAGPPDRAGRHARQRRSDRRGDLRDHDQRRRGTAPPGHLAAGGAAVAFELRHQRRAVGDQDAPRARPGARRRADAGDRRRDARRLRGRRRTAPVHHAACPRCKGDANLLVCPGIDAANISYNLLKTISGNNVAIGPILLGVARPVHILTPSATVRRIVNMAALAVVDANSQR